MVAALHEPTGLVDDARFTELHQVFCLVERNLLLKLIPAQSTVLRRAFDGQVSAFVTDTYPDGTSVTTADIPLLDVAVTIGLLLIAVAFHQEFAFDFQSAHYETMKTE